MSKFKFFFVMVFVKAILNREVNSSELTARWDAT